MPAQRQIPTASIPDTLRIIGQVLLPTVAKGPIIRRPKMVGLVERFDLDTIAVKRMQALRNTYGPGPVRLAVPVISRAVVLDTGHVQKVLDRTPEPYATETDEKRGALSHFEPKVSLVSYGAERASRRAFNEEMLAWEQPAHPKASTFIDVVHEEAADLLDRVDRNNGTLAWDPFFESWFRVVRRVVFGDSARDDTELTDLVEQLRGDGNWAFFKPQRKDMRERFFRLMENRVAQADEGSLASMFRDIPPDGPSAPLHQVPQWLFAFDPAGMATYRGLAMLATHPEHLDKARQELESDMTGRQHLPYLRACILDTLRLWPTAPMILRQTTEPTELDSGTMPKKTELLIYAPFFHRDDERLPFANRFAPEAWEDESEVNDWPLIPFSAGPGVCPGRNLVLLTTSAMLGALIEGRDVQVSSRHKLGPDAPLPGTLDNYRLRFRMPMSTGHG